MTNRGEQSSLKYRGNLSSSAATSRTASGSSSSASSRSKGFTRNHQRLFTVHILFTLVLIFSVFYIVHWMERRLPIPLTEIDSLNPEHRDRFIAEKAIKFLSELTAIGPRVAGSYENDVIAVEFMDKKLHDIDKKFNSGKYRVEIERQTASGHFPLTFLDGMTMVYNDVHNVITRIEATPKTNQSLLMNCHFDSVPDSPGASDDGAACAVMIELFRVLVSTGQPLNYNMIFLFNGAEENIMQASHGFITQHRWAKEIVGFINLEACGAGGRELLFQAGPSNPHLLDVYSQVVPYPYASTMAQEIFESGIIPGETDFRIFRDFGQLSGVDFVWSSNGYVYHTQYDNIAQIPWGALQRTGDNMLELIKGINEKGIRVKEHETSHNLVFFDILGAFVVRWKVTLSLVINLSAAALSIFTVWMNFPVVGHGTGISRLAYYKELLQAMKSQLFVWIASIVVSLSIASGLILVGRTMSWFGNPIWIYFLYVVPTLATGFIITRRSADKTTERLTNLMSKVAGKEKGAIPAQLSCWTVFQIYFDGTQILWTFVMVTTLAAGVLSGFIALLWVSFASVYNLLHHVLFKRDLVRHGWRWLLSYILLIGIPFLQAFYLGLGAVNMFLPIMGRTGKAFNSEFIIAFLMSLIFALLFSFVNQLIIVIRKDKVITRLPIVVSLVALAVLLFTNLGFPYSGQPDSLTPQRFLISNVDKKVFDFYGNLTKSKTGYWFMDMDVNSPWSVQEYLPEVLSAKRVDTCDDEIYCGLPYILPVLNFLWVTHWIDSPAFKVPLESGALLNSKTMISDQVVRLNITATGPDHMGLMFSPMAGFQLQRWSIDENTPLAGSKQFQNRNLYFVYYSYGLENRPWNFHLDFTVPKGFNVKTDPVVDLAVNGQFVHGKRKMTEQLAKLVSRLPDWTTTSGWTSTIRSYVF